MNSHLKSTLFGASVDPLWEIVTKRLEYQTQASESARHRNFRAKLRV